MKRSVFEYISLPFSRVGVLVVMSILIFAFFKYTLYDPMQVEKEKYNHTLQILSEKNRQHIVNKTNHDKNKKLYDLLKDMRRSDRTTTFLRHINNIAQKNNIRVLSIKPLENVTQLGMQATCHNLHLSGDYFSFVEFLKEFSLHAAGGVSLPNMVLSSSLFVLDMCIYAFNE